MKTKRPTRPTVPDAPPPIGAPLRDAAAALAEALSPHLAAILDASDEFKRQYQEWPAGRDRGLAELLHKAVRDEWSRLCWHRDEAARLSEERG